MNIFEQYGIKEVADVCLYSIELDENDDEIYIPILYLDTLKVSTVEQTAEQTSARGGLGNSELIIWDYGKEITVTLEDALYSPASQSLMWGGKYGTKTLALKGTYQPYYYTKDENGQDIYLYKTRREENITYIESINFSDLPKEYIPHVPTPTKNDNGEQVPNFNLYDYYYAVCFDGLPQPAKVICDTFSNFELSHGGGLLSSDVNYYKWLVNLKMISDNGIYRADLQSNKSLIDHNLQYSKDERKWNFKEVSTVLTPIENLDGTISSQISRNENITDGITFYKRIVDKNGDSFQIPIGRFTLDNKANVTVIPPQEIIYQIKKGIENVPFLERIEKCIASQTFVINCDNNLAHSNYRYLHKYDHNELTVFIDPKTMLPYEPNTNEWIRKNGQTITGSLRIIKQHEIYYKWTRTKALDHTSLGGRIIVDAIHFPGTYRLVGETYSRSRITGKDQRFQFEIPLCKMGTENNFTLEAAGDPTTFTMTLKVLRREDGVMMKLTQYDVAQETYDGYPSNSTVPVPIEEMEPEDKKPNIDYVKTLIDSHNELREELTIKSPIENTLYDYQDSIEATGEEKEYSKYEAATAYTEYTDQHDTYAYQKILNNILTSDFLFENGELKTETEVKEIKKVETILKPDDESYNLEMKSVKK